MAKKKVEIIEEPIIENISLQPLEEVMGDRYATYAKYVIQDRAIPDVRDGLKPVQRRIIFTMFKNGNTINKPTKKCAHTVGAVMGTFHPHGDSSIYEALAHMSQDWKIRYPLIDFQGNNGSIDGDLPAAYRYTESRLSELSNELVRDIEKKTVDMQLNFDDTEFEPTVLPSRFPNLLVNGTSGIAVAMATEIPPHNLREVIDAVIYRIGHKTATVEELMEFVKGPDFPGGGIIFLSEGLKNIYTTGRGRIEVASKCEVVDDKDGQQIVITEIPYGINKSALVYEIDKIIHSKAVSGMIEIRDESEGSGIRIVIDCKKDAKCDLLIKYLMAKTPLQSSFNANMVAIVNGRPKTLTLMDFVDSYIAHQVDVITRRSTFDLDKFASRLHIVDGLIKASLCINEVVEIIRKSKDKADSKINLMNAYGFSNDQAEAIVTMPLYKLSHTDEVILQKEKVQLEKDIENLKSILENPEKLNRVLVKDLKQISEKYGDDRRTQITEKGDTTVDKRDLIAKEEVILAITRDGYLKRSSIKSFKSSGDNALPGVKEGDYLVGVGNAFTTDYLVCFTNKGNYIPLSIHKLTENKWKDEGVHINQMVNIEPGEKIIKCLVVSQARNDIYLGILSKFGQIKRMCLNSIELGKYPRPSKYMKLLNGDEIAAITLLTGNSDVMVISSNGMASLFNENDLTVIGAKAAGVKSIQGLGKNQAIGLIAFDEEEKAKMIIVTDKAHERILDNTKVMRTARLGKTTPVMPCFKSDVHKIVSVIKVPKAVDSIKLNVHMSNSLMVQTIIDDLHLTDINKYAKRNMDVPPKYTIHYAYDASIDYVNKDTVSHPIVVKEKPVKIMEDGEIIEESSADEGDEVEKKDDASFEQISIFDDLD